MFSEKRVLSWLRDPRAEALYPQRRTGNTGAPQKELKKGLRVSLNYRKGLKGHSKKLNSSRKWQKETHIGVFRQQQQSGRVLNHINSL